MDTRPLEVANTIKSQISQHQLMCYAAREFAAVGGKDYLHGLRFTVSGTSVLKNRKGIIQILLNGSDLYDITLFRKNKPNEVKKDIYAEDLNVTLDMLLETKEYWEGMLE